MGAFSTIFINRPIMASVISIVIVLLKPGWLHKPQHRYVC